MQTFFEKVDAGQYNVEFIVAVVLLLVGAELLSRYRQMKRSK